MTTAKKLVNLVLAPLLIFAMVMLVRQMISARPEPKKRDRRSAEPIVELIISEPGTHGAEIRTYGNVRAYHEARIASRVGGEILRIGEDFEVGLLIKEGDLLVSIDPADFEAAVADRKGAVAAAEQVLAEEEARSKLAEEDWIATGRSLDKAPAFTLRKPQLAAADASLSAAKAALARAKLDLERTIVTAPFDAIIGSRSTSPGNIIAAGTELGTLISRDRVEVRLPLTPEQARLIDLPLAFNVDAAVKPIAAVLHAPVRPGHPWDATITRTEAAVDSRNQVLYVIAEVTDPFRSHDDFLPIGAFVEATLPSRPAPGTHRLPVSALVEDRFIWVINEDNSLVEQPITRISSSDGYFLGRLPDDSSDPLRVITRPLVSFVEGTLVKPRMTETNDRDQP